MECCLALCAVSWIPSSGLTFRILFCFIIREYFSNASSHFVVLFNVLKISSASFLSCYISHLERRWVDTKARVDFLLSSILRCDETNFCSLDANLDGLEEDPCPKTEKYLEAHFVCHSLTDGPPRQGWSTSSVKSTSVNSKCPALSTNYVDDSDLGGYTNNINASE